MSGYPTIDDDGFVESVAEAMETVLSAKTELDSYERSALEMLSMPGERFLPAVYGGMTMMVVIRESEMKDIDEMFSDTFHSRQPAAIPVLLRKEQWTGGWLHGEVNWFLDYVRNSRDSSMFSQFVVMPIEAAVMMMSAPFPVNMSALSVIHSTSHEMLHERGIFESDEDEYEDGDLINDIGSFLKQQRDTGKGSV